MHEYQLQEKEIEASDPRAKRARTTINDTRPGFQPESQVDKEVSKVGDPIYSLLVSTVSYLICADALHNPCITHLRYSTV